MPTFDNSYPVSLYVNNRSNATVPAQPFVQSTSMVSSRIQKGGPVRNFKLRLALGKDCTTVMDGHRARYIPVSTRMLERHVDGRYWESSGSLNSASSRLYEACTTPITTAHDLTAYGNASAAYVKQYQKQTRKLEAFVSLGEMGETLRGFVNPLRSFRRGLDDLVAKYETNFRRWRRVHKVKYETPTDRARTLLEMMSGTWLEWRFGMIPTMSDIDGAARAIAVIAEGPALPRISVTAMSTYDFHESLSQQLSFTGGWGNPQNQFLMLTATSIGVRIKTGISSLAESYPTPYDALGLTIEDFAPSLYELIPFSFLEGYFGNAKEVIDVWAHQYMQVTWACRNTLRERKRHVQGPTSTYNTTTYRTHVDNFDQKVYRREVFRIPLDPNSFLHIPSYNFTIPGLGMKWVNMGALAAQYGRLLNDIGSTIRI